MEISDVAIYAVVVFAFIASVLYPLFLSIQFEVKLVS